MMFTAAHKGNKRRGISPKEKTVLHSAPGWKGPYRVDQLQETPQGL